MPGMRDQFSHFYVPDEDAIATAMKTGLVTPDANVLLNLYRFQTTARDELFGALEKLGDRLWIPHQVGLEFQRNRLGVMKDQEGYFAKTRDEVLNAVGGLHGKVRAFGNRLGLAEEQTKEIDDAISALNDRIADVVLRAEGQNEVRLHDHACDEVLARVDALFANDNSVGKSMEPKDLEAARKEAERRIKEKIPPGYKDRDKDDPTGDYIVWRQLMDEAKIRKLPVVFITDDSRSDDWYRREHGMTLGARRELREEMMREAGVSLLMMTTETFLLHAKTYLNATVSEETVEQAKELPSAVRPDVTIADSNVNRFLLRALLVPQSSASTSSEQSDLILRGIATGVVKGPAELAAAMRLLRTELDRMNMIRKVASAVGEGQASGMLSVEDGNAVLEALSRSINGEQEAGLYSRAANRRMPMDRAAFERALEVSPERDGPGEVAQARRIIAMNLERRHATSDDRDRGAAWFLQYNRWLLTQLRESQEDPPAED